MDPFRDLKPGELPFIPEALKRNDIYNNYVRSEKSGSRIYYHPDEITNCHDIYISPGVDVYGNEYRILWEVDGNHYKIKDMWRFVKECGTWCRW